MMTTTAMGVEVLNDTELVAESLAGDRDAFGQIVARYQTLICSLVYSATGSLRQSEDLAQDTFVTAWKELRHLREPGRLRSWLCQIARNLTYDTLRGQGREPAHGAGPIETAHDVPAPEPLPSEQAIRHEEEALLWLSLEKIPETYREPLVLFYREHQSVERVALSLELTEDAVKQRLSRGRKLLQEQVLAFVEGTLARTSPGQAFTVGVLAALPMFTMSAKAATIAAAAAKGSAAAKSAGLVGLANAVLGPVVMFLSLYFGFRLDRDSARSPQRREFVIKCYRILVACIVMFTLAVFSLILGGGHFAEHHPRLFAGLLIGLGVAWTIVFGILNLWMRERRRKLREQEIAGSLSSPAGQAADFRPVPLVEYRSKLSLLGLPLIHIRLRGGLERGPVKAWIAAGDAAIGVIFAFGGLAIAPISFGGFSLGLLTLGGLGVGVVTVSGFSLGLWAVGGMAVGLQAFGGCAVAWSAAQGGVAVAHDFARGAVAIAAHANDAVTEAFMLNSTFFQNTLAAMRYAPWLNLLLLLPLTLWCWDKMKRKQLRPGN